VSRGHLGGLATHARYGTDTVVGRALAGKRARFVRLALEAPDAETLTPAELEAAADRLERQAMLALAQRSAAVRRARKAGPG